MPPSPRACAGGGLALALLALLGCSRTERAKRPPGRDLFARPPDQLSAGGTAWFEDPQRLVLQPGGRAGFALLLPEGGRLVLDGRAQGRGALAVRLTASDPVWGTTRELGELPPIPPAADGRLAVELPLPEGEGDILLVEIAWSSDEAGSALLLERCRLVEGRSPIRRPSIVFVSIDTLAARHMSLYGYPRRTTPRIDRLAGSSIVFERCVANAPWTTPSYISQFTGLYAKTFWTDPRDLPPDRHGNVPGTWFLPDERWTIAELLRAAGYRTAAFVDNPMAGGEFGLAQGFEVFDASAAGIGVRETDGGIRHLLPRAREWLGGLGRDEPFFLFLQSLDVHSPYLPPERTAGRFAEDAPEGEVRPVGYTGYLFGCVARYAAQGVLGAAPLPERMATGPFVAAYDEEILDLDLALGGFFDELEREGILDDAIVVFTADHGESLTEHDWYFQHGTCYDEVLHVPLLIRLPRGAGGGRRIEQGVQLVDLFATLVDLAGLRTRIESLHGRSLVALLHEQELEPVPFLSEPGIGASASLELGDWKLIETRPARNRLPTLLSHPRVRSWVAHRLGLLEAGLPDDPAAVALLMARLPDPEASLRELRAAMAGPFHELYYLPDDPLELRDLASDEPERLAELIALLAKERERVASARTAFTLPEAVLAPSEELLEEMRALGYVDGE